MYSEQNVTLFCKEIFHFFGFYYFRISVNKMLKNSFYNVVG